VGDDDDVVAILGREPPQRIQQANLRGDIQVESGSSGGEEEAAVEPSARKDDALLFAAGDLIHPAVAELAAPTCARAFSRLRHRLRIRSAASAHSGGGLQTNSRRAREEQGALLLDDSDSLRARARRKRGVTKR